MRVRDLRPFAAFALSIFAIAILPILLLTTSCDRPTVSTSGKAATTNPALPATRPTIASMVPAATDLLIGMGAKDHVVAVSNWDADRPEIAGLPRVGDYRTIDFERLTLLRPSVLIAQYRADKMPPGLRERADKLQMELVNIHANRLEEIFTAIDELGRAAHEPAKATALRAGMHSRLDAVRNRVANAAPVSVLLVRDAAGYDVVGGGNFLDDVLTVAGGKNVLAGGDNSYPTIDKEQLVSLDPEFVIQLLPGASPQVKEQATRHWDSLGGLRAVRDKHVFLLDDYYLLLPSHHMADVAEKFADLLHPKVNPAPGVSP